jgi:hypothetical protein
MNLVTIWLPENENREVFTAKTDSGYVGCVKMDKCTIMTREFFEKPLVAANAARKLSKTLKENGLVKETVKVKTQKVKETKPKTLGKLTGKLFTDEQRCNMPLLSFQEVWVVTRENEYVLDCLNTEKKLLCSYTDDRQAAKRFKDYEEARRVSTTLKGVVGPGFNISRYWLKVS